ncbi:MAG: hypothetical protein JXB40_04945 [Candidatus Omnitrophica bacterium]|nr:hypothetical protein [Candidatus Omnitrophota bacterium]
MIDRKTEQDIRSLKEFLELWTKFHSMYDEAISRENISGEDEAKFLEARDKIKGRYLELKKTLGINYVPHSRLTDPADDVLAINSMRMMSEKSLKKLNEDWKDSYIFLNSIMENLKSRKKHLEGINPAVMFFGKLFGRRDLASNKGGFPG